MGKLNNGCDHCNDIYGMGIIEIIDGAYKDRKFEKCPECGKSFVDLVEVEQDECRHCDYHSKDFELLDGDDNPVPAYPALNQVFMKDKQIYILTDNGNRFIDADYCLKCGRDLKTGNRMIEVEALEFPSWEEFQKEKQYEKKSTYYKIRIIMMNGTISCGITAGMFYSDGLFKNVIIANRKGYEQAIEFLNKIRIKFIIELCKG